MLSTTTFLTAILLCFAISTVLIIYLLGLQSRIDIEKTSIMNVVLLLIVCKEPVEIKFYLFLYYS